MNSTDRFENNQCLDSKEDSIVSLYVDLNCYYKISIGIRNELMKLFPNVAVIIGETAHYSNYNAGSFESITLSLGPLYFMIFVN
jgi:hypothetical protein